jgi:Mitochondrial domain of unknown function (DUF1713)
VCCGHRVPDGSSLALDSDRVARRLRLGTRKKAATLSVTVRSLLPMRCWLAPATLRRLGWQPGMGSLIKKRRKRMRKKKHKKMLKATRWQRRAGR